MDEMDDMRMPIEEDVRTEAAVLRWLLALHPAQPSFEELLREICEEPGDFAQRDAVERAVRDLAAAGLVHRREGFVVPSLAALSFERLLGE